MWDVLEKALRSDLTLPSTVQEQKINATPDKFKDVLIGLHALAERITTLHLC